MSCKYWQNVFVLEHVLLQHSNTTVQRNTRNFAIKKTPTLWFSCALGQQQKKGLAIDLDPGSSREIIHFSCPPHASSINRFVAGRGFTWKGLKQAAWLDRAAGRWWPTTLTLHIIVIMYFYCPFFVWTQSGVWLSYCPDKSKLVTT